MEEPPPRMRACSYLRSGGGLSCGIVVRDHLGADLELGPVEARVEVGGAGIAVEHLRRDLAVRRVLARLEQQHLGCALGRQPVGQHRPGRAAADDDEVVGHGCWHPLPWLRASSVRRASSAALGGYSLPRPDQRVTSDNQPCCASLPLGLRDARVRERRFAFEATVGMREWDAGRKQHHMANLIPKQKLAFGGFTLVSPLNPQSVHRASRPPSGARALRSWDPRGRSAFELLGATRLPR